MQPFEPAYMKLPDGELRDRAAHALTLLADCRALPPRLRRQPAGGPLVGLQDRSPRRGQQPLPALRRGGLPARLARLGHDLLLPLQSALRLLPEPRHQPGRQGRPRGPRNTGGDGRDDARAAGCAAATTSTSSRPSTSCPRSLEALPIAVAGGLRLPLVYNTSAYDCPESIELMNGIVDVYMPDFKYWKTRTAKTYLKAADYPGLRAGGNQGHARAGRAVGVRRERAGDSRCADPPPGDARRSRRDTLGPRVDRRRAGTGDLRQPDGSVPPGRQGRRRALRRDRSSADDERVRAGARDRGARQGSRASTSAGLIRVSCACADPASVILRHTR